MWTAENIVDLAGVIVWPVASILLALILRRKISGFIDSFFNRNNVTELSAGGFTAKFAQLSQVTGRRGEKQESIISDSKVDEDAADYLDRLSLDETKTSVNIYRKIKNHIESLGLSSEQIIDSLQKELSQANAKLYFLDLNRTLYRSQYDFLKLLKDNSGKLSEAQVSLYYNSLKTRIPMVYGHIDLINYLAYPMNVGLIEKHAGNYRLTDYGDSYVTFMDRNSNLIVGLVQS